jgi:hypothetical protein
MVSLDVIYMNLNGNIQQVVLPTPICNAINAQMQFDHLKDMISLHLDLIAEECFSEYEFYLLLLENRYINTEFAERNYRG